MAVNKGYAQRRFTEMLRKLLLTREKEEHAKKMKEFKKMTSHQSDIFRIAVCGKFKTGKTSLLNLLLDLDLPVMAVTATGVVTKIACHASMSAELKDGSRKAISKSELNKYITVAGKDLDGIKYSEAVSVDVPCESPLMMNGKVEFWDTPGLEDDRRLTEITLDAVKKCDLAVLVMNATQILSQKEKLFLYQMQEMLGGNVLVIINRWDMLREDEKPGVRKTAETFLKKFGNDCCGYGRFLMTSANPNAPYIDSLRNKLYDICEDERVRREYSSHARSARIDYFVREWGGQLGQDIDWLESCLNSCKNRVAEEESRRTEELKKDYKEKKSLVKGRLSELMCRVDERSYWTNSLSGVKSTAGWETQYVELSTDIMKKSLHDIYQKAREATGEYFAAREYPECYPLPVMSEENVWDKMAWGYNVVADNNAGIFAGAAAGAAVGSVLPVIGTFAGAVLGFVAGAIRDDRQNDEDREAFKSNCIDRTVTAFYKGPSWNAKNEIQNYMNELFRRLEEGVKLKCIEIKDKLAEGAAADNEYHESSLLLDELLEYREELRRYSETGNLELQMQKRKFSSEDEAKMQHMDMKERMEYVQNSEPEQPPFTRWLTFGNHLYRRSGERCDVEFIDNRSGIRKIIVDNNGNIIDFPGIEKGEWMKFIASENYLRPIIRFRTSFQKYDDKHYIMIWEVQPEGRYWEDEDGFGGNGDTEVCLYALIDHTGCFTGPFQIYTTGGTKYLDRK